MANMSNIKNPMPTLDAALRARCFDEVATGYSEETALNEAARCLNCKKPFCVEGCPVKNTYSRIHPEIEGRGF